MSTTQKSKLFFLVIHFELAPKEKSLPVCLEAANFTWQDECYYKSIIFSQRIFERSPPWVKTSKLRQPKRCLEVSRRNIFTFDWAAPQVILWSWHSPHPLRKIIILNCLNRIYSFITLAQSYINSNLIVDLEIIADGDSVERKIQSWSWISPFLAHWLSSRPRASLQEMIWRSTTFTKLKSNSTKHSV